MHRISNFLLWQFAYTELYFTECFWPDFGAAEFAAALRDYAARERRFGGAPGSRDRSGSGAMLKQRVLTALVFAALVIGVVLYAPVALTAALFGLLVLGASWEWAALAGFTTRGARLGYVALVALALILGARLVGAPAGIDAAAIARMLCPVLGFWLLAALRGSRLSARRRRLGRPRRARRHRAAGAGAAVDRGAVHPLARPRRIPGDLRDRRDRLRGHRRLLRRARDRRRETDAAGQPRQDLGRLRRRHAGEPGARAGGRDAGGAGRGAAGRRGWRWRARAPWSRYSATCSKAW